MSDLVRIAREADVVRIALHRPEVKNALNEALIEALIRSFEEVAADESIATIVLSGVGKSFCAGADIGWMHRSGTYDREQQIADLLPLGRMLHALERLPQTTIARVHGPVYGGGIGLVAACDIAIGSWDSTFCLSEVRLGIVPGMVAPYALRALGERAARRYFQTAEVFDASDAKRLGLLHELESSDQLDHRIGLLLEQLRCAAPFARKVAKRSIGDFRGRSVDADLMSEIAALIADVRSGPEAVEGFSAFLEKREASWH
jgi:methylglutaconyl-CoA hydratase